MKKAISWLLAMAMIFTMLPTVAFATDEENVYIYDEEKEYYTDITIVQDTTWTDSYLLSSTSKTECTLTIKNGATLTLNGGSIAINDYSNFTIQGEDSTDGKKASIVVAADITDTDNYSAPIEIDGEGTINNLDITMAEDAVLTGCPIKLHSSDGVTLINTTIHDFHIVSYMTGSLRQPLHVISLFSSTLILGKGSSIKNNTVTGLDSTTSTYYSSIIYVSGDLVLDGGEIVDNTVTDGAIILVGYVSSSTTLCFDSGKIENNTGEITAYLFENRSNNYIYWGSDFTFKGTISINDNNDAKIFIDENSTSFNSSDVVIRTPSGDEAEGAMIVGGYDESNRSTTTSYVEMKSYTISSLDEISNITILDNDGQALEERWYTVVDTEENAIRLYGMQYYTITLEAGDGGNVSFSYPDTPAATTSQVFSEYDTFEICATPDDGYLLEGWYLDGEQIDDHTVYEVTTPPTADATYTAKFYFGGYKIATYTAGQGSVMTTLKYTNENGDIDDRTEVTLTATPDANYKFVGWYNGDTLVSEEAVYTFAATGSESYTAHFELDVQEEYTITFVPQGTAYYPGDTIVVDVVASATAETATVSHFQFAPDYDETVLTLDSVTTTFTGAELDYSETNGLYIFNTSGSGTQTVGADGVTIATMTFTVNPTTTATSTTLDLEDTVVTGQDAAITATTVEAKTITILDPLTVTFTAVDYTSFSTVLETDVTSLTAYAKQGEAGLYTDCTYTESFIFPTVVLPSGIDYASGGTWKKVDTDVIYQDNAALLTAVASLTESMEVSPNVDICEVTFGLYRTASTTPTFSYSGPLYVTAGTTITLPTLTMPEHYSFEAWLTPTEDGNHYHFLTAQEDGTYTYEITDDIYFAVWYIADGVEVSETSTNATVNLNANGAYYGTDYIFNVTADDDYTISSVAYSVEGGGTAILIAPTHDPSTDTYTYIIPGEQITGDITIEAVASKYIEVEFVSATDDDDAVIATVTTTTAYAVANKVGLYASMDDIASGSPNFVFPTATAEDGYRIANEANESQWTDGTNDYSEADMYVSTAFSSSVTLYPNVVETVVVTVSIDQIGLYSWLNGAGDWVYITVDSGTTYGELEFPEATTNPGYEITAWRCYPSIGTNVPLDDYSVAITVDTIIVGTLEKASFPVTYNSDYIKITYGLTDGKATYMTDLKFATLEGDYTVDNVYYRTGTGSAQLLPDTDDSTYTVGGHFITGPISIWVETTDSYTVNFYDSDNTTLSTTNVTTGNTVTSLSDPTPPTAMQFDYWVTDTDAKMTTADILAMPITRNISFTAHYSQAMYTVTYVDENGDPIEGLSGVPTTAYGGQSFSFTPAIEGASVRCIQVYYTAQGTSSAYFYPDDNGEITVGESTVIYDLKIVIYYNQGTVSFIYDSQYKALTSDTKIAVLTDAEDDTNYTFNNTSMFYSKAYGAYLLIVDADITAATFARYLYTGEATVPTITYETDVNGDGNINVTDAGRVHAFLNDLAITGAEGGNGCSTFNNYVSTSQQEERLKADVNSNQYVSVLDIEEIITAIKG